MKKFLVAATVFLLAAAFPALAQAKKLSDAACRLDGGAGCGGAAGGGGDALTANPLSQFAPTTSAQLAGVISNETGSGLLPFATEPTLTSPTITKGTPAYAAAFTGGHVGIGTVTPGYSDPTAGRTILTLEGSSDTGVLELATAAADADGNVLGVIQFTDKNSIAADKRITSIGGLLSGSTAKNRGGALRFFTKPDGASGMVERARFTDAGVFNVKGPVQQFTATQAAASQAGVGLTVAADPAVAGSSVAGAAAGGTVALRAGNAARLTSGNANGGDIDLTGVGAGVGTGTAGQVLLPSGTAASPALAFAGSPSRATGMFWATNYVGFASGGVASFAVGFGSANIGAGTLYSGTSLTGTDTGLSRAAAAVWRTTDAGGATSSWLQITPGESRVTTQFDATTTTLADITGLTSTLIAGRKYRFRATLFVDADAVGGVKFSVAGTATETSIVYQVNVIRNDTSVFAITSRKTALGGAGVGTAAATAYYVEIVGTIVCNAAGTLRPQFAQNVASGTSSVLVNSTWNVVDIP